MEITPLGHASFKIKGKTTTVITDPYQSQMVGLKFPKHASCDIVTISHHHDDHDFLGAVEGAPFVVEEPGEYEIKGVSIVGLSSYHDEKKGSDRGRNTIYRIEIDDIAIVHLGDLGHTLAAPELEILDGVDILMIPVGGVVTIDARQAAAITKEIEPSLVIPMHYGRSELSEQVFGKLAPVSSFLKEIGKEAGAPLPKLTISKDKLPEEMQVVVLAC